MCVYLILSLWTTMANASLPFVAAPMVNQSDLPFRLLARKHGATMTYTQMLVPEKLLNDQDYLEYHIRDLTAASAHPLNGPVVVQLCGHDPDTIVQAGKKLQNYCTAIGAAARHRRQLLVYSTCFQTSILDARRKRREMAITEHTSCLCRIGPWWRISVPGLVLLIRS